MFRMAKAQPPARSGLHPGSARVGSFVGPETEKLLNVLRIDTGTAFLSNEIDVAAALANHLCASSIAHELYPEQNHILYRHGLRPETLSSSAAHDP